MKFKSFISKLLVIIFTLTVIITGINPNDIKADSFSVVTLGADLTEEQKSQMLEYFGVKANDVNILTVTSAEEYEALGNVATSAQLGSKSISCSYVEPTSKGGLDIKSNNLTWVTVGMIRNALITAGVENDNVIVSAPFKVSGTAALTGILKGFESSKAGEKIDEDKKEAANEEIVVTGNLGDKIGQDDAANLMNDIKTEVIKESPKNDSEVEEIIQNSVDKYNYELSQDDINEIKSVMNKINDLDLNYKDLKHQLNAVTDSLKDKISAEEVKGFFSKIGDFFSNIWNWFKGLFSSDDSDIDNNSTNTNNQDDLDINTEDSSDSTNNTNSLNSNEENNTSSVTDNEGSNQSEKVDDTNSDFSLINSDNNDTDVASSTAN